MEIKIDVVYYLSNIEKQLQVDTKFILNDGRHNAMEKLEYWSMLVNKNTEIVIIIKIVNP